jgi:hypothetical protein
MAIFKRVSAEVAGHLDDGAPLDLHRSRRSGVEK